MPIYTVKEAASLLRLSVASVYALCAAKKLRHQRVGVGRGKILIPADAIDEYLAQSAVPCEDTIPAPAPVPIQRNDQVKTFAHLDSARLLEAWKKQGKA